MIIILAVQSLKPTQVHNDILFIDTPTMLGTKVLIR